MPQYFLKSDDPMDVAVLEGFDAIQERATLLEQLAERCGQPGAMHWLSYFLGGTGARWKRPYLVLFLKPGVGLGTQQPEDLRAAVLFYELRVLGIRTGAFSTDDFDGVRTVIAPPGMRNQVIAMATVALMRQGAHVVLTSYQGATTDGTEPGPMLERPGLLWAERNREVKNQMLLGSTLDETLAKFGKTTRFNLRYYRKRLLGKMDCEFVPDVRGMISEVEFTALNAGALNPVAPAECKRRYRGSNALAGGFMIGLRAPDGQWLSLLGGWRQGTTTVMYYQINSAGYEKDSIGTVMRSFFLESEIARGTKKLVFYRGTKHSMSHSFDVEVVRDLLVRRETLRANILCRLAGLFTSGRRLGGSTSFLARALKNDSLEWHAAKAGRRKPRGAGDFALIDK